MIESLAHESLRGMGMFLIVIVTWAGTVDIKWAGPRKFSISVTMPVVPKEKHCGDSDSHSTLWPEADALASF
jgi:hypothetical protein